MSLTERTVHVKGFQAPINPTALQAGLRRFGWIERIHLWTSASGKEHAFVVYRDADAVDAAVGSYKAVTVEHIRRSPDLQARLKDMSESWSKRLQDSSFDAGGCRIQNSAKGGINQRSGRPAPYSDPTLHPARIKEPGAQNDRIRRDDDRESRVSPVPRSNSRRAFPESKRRLPPRDEPKDSGRSKPEKPHDFVDFDYDFSKYPNPRRRSRERSPRGFDRREKERVSHRSRAREEASSSTHKKRKGDGSPHRHESPSRRSERPRRGRSPTPANHSGHHRRKSHVSAQQATATSMKETNEKPSKVARGKSNSSPRLIPMTPASSDAQPRSLPAASFHPVIKMEEEDEPVVLGHRPSKALDQTRGHDQLPGSCPSKQSRNSQTRPGASNTRPQSPPTHTHNVEPPSPTQAPALSSLPSLLQTPAMSSPVRRALLSEEPRHIFGLSQEVERHVVQVIQEAYKEDALDAHRKACLLITEYGSKAMWDLADLVGRECVSYCSQRKASGLSVPPLRPVYLALATCKARQARTVRAADQHQLMLASSTYINCAEEAEEPPASLNFIRMNLLGSLSVPAPPDQLIPPQDVDSDGYSIVPSSQNSSTSKPKPVDPIPTQPRSRPFEMQALRMQVTSLRSSLSAISEDIRTERGSKRKAEEYLSQEKSKARCLERELQVAEEDKQRLENALRDERARRAEAEDEVWKLKRAETKPKPIPSWYC
ncbi:hypothetical protein FS837_003033 [Tulasnella sp. UAMH 9824]|nr:hypothetical protein FS837_003033 [Tulasnella sp. UAMH 9824]